MKYVEKRDFLIEIIIELTQLVYPDDRKMLSDVIDRTVDLKLAEQHDDFINGMLSFTKDSIDKQSKNSTVLTTLIHDLGEFCRHRNEDWFSPRTNRFAVEFKDSDLLSIKIDKAILEEEVMELRDALEEIKLTRELTLSERLVFEAGVNLKDIANYCSDLQVLYTTETMQWLKDNYEHNSIIVTHIGDVEGSDWFGKKFIEIPFAYTEHHNHK